MIDVREIRMKDKTLLVVVALALMLSGRVICPVGACTSIIIGKDRSVTGTVMLGHNEDLGKNSAHHLVVRPAVTYRDGDCYETISGAKLPQPPETCRYIASKIFDKNHYPGDITSGVNEHRVAVVNNMSWSRDVPKETAWEKIEGGVIWTEFTQMALERAKTAREAVLIIGDLVERCKLSMDPGTMFAVVDPGEGWWVEVARGGQWIAVRVPDDAAQARANCFRIGAVDLDDGANVLHSKTIIEYAVKAGWFEPGVQKFDFARVYGDGENNVDPYNTVRHEMIESMLGEADNVSVAEMMAVLRTTYEDTEHYKEDKVTGSPFKTGVRTVARLSTEISAVVEFKKDLPAQLGTVMWWNMGTPNTGCYIPWYLGTLRFPEPFQTGTENFSDNSAYWIFFELTRLAHAHYRRVMPGITRTWSAFENHEMTMQEAVEREVLVLYREKGPEAAMEFVTWYSSALASRSLDVARKLIRDIKTETYREE